MNMPFASPGPRKRSDMLALLVTLRQLPPETRRIVLAGLPEWVVDALREEWWWQARGGQIEPRGDWRIWAIVAGRGFGKTRAGAEWVSQRAREDPKARIALVAASRDEVARVMVEGESGILAVARTGEAPRWIASRGLVVFRRAHAPTPTAPRSLSNCGGRSIITPGATSLPNGPGRPRPGTI